MKIKTIIILIFGVLTLANLVLAYVWQVTLDPSSPAIPLVLVGLALFCAFEAGRFWNELV